MLQGLATIRAFHSGGRLQEKFHSLLDTHTSGWLCFVGLSRWLGVRLELMSVAYLAVVVYAALLVFDFGDDLNLDTGTLGLSITYQISLYGFLQWVMRTSAEVENLVGLVWDDVLVSAIWICGMCPPFVMQTSVFPSCTVIFISIFQAVSSVNMIMIHVVGFL